MITTVIKVKDKPNNRKGTNEAQIDLNRRFFVLKLKYLSHQMITIMEFPFSKLKNMLFASVLLRLTKNSSEI